MKSFVIVNKTKGKLASLPFARIARAVLGARYTLDLIFVTPAESRHLNHLYRKKEKPANVLSFPLAQNEGEIVICPAEARRQASQFHRTPQNFIGFLFIHALLHLKGYRHGSTMERKEKRLSARFLRS